MKRKPSLHISGRDWINMLGIAVSQSAMAWLMAWLGMVYAPIPMFAAAIIAGLLFKGRPQLASLMGAVAGILGGLLAERAYHLIRLERALMNWAELSSGEQLGLSLAEMILYASLLSFFAAFISWGTSKEEKRPIKKENVTMVDDPDRPQDLKVELPLFKADPPENQNFQKPNDQS